MDPNKTCFVISPIGDEGSDVRNNADDLYDLIIEPALEVFGFTVIRADKIIGSGQINSEVITLVQNAELCIVDLTGHNANVFYECGRRHETAKPFIQLIRLGDTLPFDVAGIRTIQYDLSNPRSAHKTIQDIRRTVAQFEEGGYATSSSGVSTVTLAQAIDRLERKFDKLVAQGVQSEMQAIGVQSTPATGLTLERYFDNPEEAFMKAIAVGSVDQALPALRRLQQISSDKHKILLYAGLIATAGNGEGAAIVRSILHEWEDYTDKAYSTGIHALVRYYTRTDTEDDGIDEVLQLISPALDADLDSETQARLNNQIQMMYYGAKRYEEAQKYALEAIKLQPDDRAFKFNLSLIYEARGLLDLAEQVVDEYMALPGSPNPSHLGQAVDIYVARDRLDDARTAFRRLQELDPSTAAMKTMLDGKLRAALEA